jgi:hypothetical protein
LTNIDSAEGFYFFYRAVFSHYNLASLFAQVSPNGRRTTVTCFVGGHKENEMFLVCLLHIELRTHTRSAERGWLSFQNCHASKSFLHMKSLVINLPLLTSLKIAG